MCDYVIGILELFRLSTSNLKNVSRFKSPRRLVSPTTQSNSVGGILRPPPRFLSSTGMTNLAPVDRITGQLMLADLSNTWFDVNWMFFGA